MKLNILKGRESKVAIAGGIFLMAASVLDFFMDSSKNKIILLIVFICGILLTLSGVMFERKKKEKKNV
jgi:hypothetical protein